MVFLSEWQGKTFPPQDDPKGSITATVNLQETVTTQHHDPIYRTVGVASETVILRDGTPLNGASNTHFGYIAIGEAGTLALAVGNNKESINLEVNYQVVNGEVKLFFDGDNYKLIGTPQIRAIVSDTPIAWDNNTNGQHLGIGIGLKNAYTALNDEWSGNGGYLFVHFEGVQAFDLHDIIGCKLASTDSVNIPSTKSFSFVVRNEGGEEVGTTDLPLGKYTVELFVDGVSSGVVKQVEITADGQTINVDFGDVIVGQKQVVDCLNTKCPGWI